MPRDPEQAAGFSTVLGFPPNLDAVELLFTSLFVQATSALTYEGSKRVPAARSRTRSFRQPFLASYAFRIGVGLAEAAGVAECQAAAEASGTALLPVLATRDKAGDDATNEMSLEPTDHRMTGITGQEGRRSSQTAADRADLNVRTALPDDHR